MTNKPSPPGSKDGSQDSSSSSQDKAAEAPRTSKQRWFRLLALLLPFVLVEGGARLYWSLYIFKLSSQDELRTELFWEGKWDKAIPYTFTPGMSAKVHETPTRVNNQGFRGDHDFPLANSSSKLRVVCIGDSVTFGYTVSGNAAAYPAVLENLLREKIPSARVLNGGMPRYRTDHMANLFEPNMPVLKPDVLVILGGWNDINEYILASVPDSPSMQWIQEHVYTIKVAQSFGLNKVDRVPAKIEEDGFQRYSDGLLRLIKLGQAHGAKVYVCNLPHFFEQLNDEAAIELSKKFSPKGSVDEIVGVMTRVNRLIEDLAKDQGVSFIDLTAINQADCFGDAIHPNDKGSRLIAEAVAKALLTH